MRWRAVSEGGTCVGVENVGLVDKYETKKIKHLA